MADFTIPKQQVGDPMYCPFCGGESIVQVNDDVYFVACLDCGALGPMSMSVSNAINLWNYRLKSCARNDK